MLLTKAVSKVSIKCFSKGVNQGLYLTHGLEWGADLGDDYNN